MADEELQNRVRRVEDEQARVREVVAQARRDAAAARVLAAGADRDVADVRAELRAHTGALHALRETQREMFEAQRETSERVDRVEMRMTQGFATLNAGMRHITVLLERALGAD